VTPNENLSSLWMRATIKSFPALDGILASCNHDVLIIGAVVLQFYKTQGWIQSAETDPIRRRYRPKNARA
jgi:hypothetical protein